MKKFLLMLAALMAVSAGFSASAQDSNDKYILTPKAPSTPRINGARVYGAHPGADFLYRIPCTGERPMTFSAEGLPKGLKLDTSTGIITGSVKLESSNSYVVVCARSAQ